RLRPLCSRELGLQQAPGVLQWLLRELDADPEGKPARPRRCEPVRVPDRCRVGNRGGPGLRLCSRHRDEPVELPGDRAGAGGDEASGPAAEVVQAAPAPLQAYSTIEGVSSASDPSVTSARASASSPGGKCGFGIAITRIPAAFAERIPLRESSTAAQRSGGTPSS